jgi:hypothetical protein
MEVWNGKELKREILSDSSIPLNEKKTKSAPFENHKGCGTPSM